MAAKKKTVKSKPAAGKKAATRKKAATTRKAVARKAAPKKTSSKKTTSKKTAAKKAVAKKSLAGKKAAKKKVAKKAPVKKAAAKKTTSRNSAKKQPATQVGPVSGIAPYKEKRGEEYMNDEQIAHFRDILMTWKRELMEEVDRTVHHMQDDAANFPDPNDRATQESEFSMELRARDRERKLIKKIEESIRNLDNDEFGYCEACGVEIGIRRLEARPTATLCIDCKILDEIREKQMG
ncbi:MAG: RNA polymerase-binding protein DksA [Gammaproteobacteria bacterium]|jgi:DnaK suppressor protein